jgi:hypothetical protein
LRGVWDSFAKHGATRVPIITMRRNVKPFRLLVAMCFIFAELACNFFNFFGGKIEIAGDANVDIAAPRQRQHAAALKLWTFLPQPSRPLIY